MTDVPAIRVRSCNRGEVRADGRYVLYWLTACRRLGAAAGAAAGDPGAAALDGRDPNSYSGIFWCFGRYDRPWAPERPVLGSVRYMSSESTRRKFRVDAYVERYARQAQMSLL